MADHRYKTLIFDFDGTIADTMDSMISIVNSNPSEYGVDGIDATEIPRLKNMSVPYLLKEFNVHLLQLPLIAQKIRRELSKQADEIKPFEGMPELLAELHASGYRLGILTSNLTSTVKKFVKNNNMPYFDFIQTELSLFGKHTALKKVMRKRRLNEESVIYIGDEVRDIEATQKIGIPIIAVTWGYNSEEILMKHKPDYLCTSPGDLRAILLS